MNHQVHIEGFGVSRPLGFVFKILTHQILDGLSTIARTDGYTGLFRGTTLALVGVSNGAIQFMAYEKMKKWGFDQKRKQAERAGKHYNQDLDKLVRMLCQYFRGLIDSCLVKPSLYNYVYLKQVYGFGGDIPLPGGSVTNASE